MALFRRAALAVSSAAWLALVSACGSDSTQGAPASPTSADGATAVGGGAPGGGTANGGTTGQGGDTGGAGGGDASAGGSGGGAQGGGFQFDGSVDGTIGGDGATPAGAIVLTVDNTLVRTLPAVFHGYNYVGYWDDNQGSAASAQVLHRVGMQITRFPGGAPANTWLWYDPYKDSGNGKSKTNTDQLWAYQQQLSPTGFLLLQTNPTTNNGNDPSPAKIQAWVADTVSKNINVMWEIGNEPDMNASSGTDAAMVAYYDAFNQQSQAIHQACPKCIVMGPAIFSQAMGKQMLEQFVAHCDANADAISIHAYIGNDGGGEQLDRKASQNWLTQYQYLRTVTTKPIYITEWSVNLHPDWYHMGGKVPGAVNNADLLGAFASSPGVAGHTFFGAVHTIWTNWGMLSDNGWADSRAIGAGVDLHAAMVPMLQLWASVMGREVIKVTSSGDPMQVNGWAHRRSDGSVQVMLINKLGTDSPVRVSFTGFDPTGHVVLVHELKAKDPDPWNCPDTYCAQYYYNGVLNAQLATADAPPPAAYTCAGANVDATLPPLSVTVLDFAP